MTVASLRWAGPVALLAWTACVGPRDAGAPPAEPAAPVVPAPSAEPAAPVTPAPPAERATPLVAAPRAALEDASESGAVQGQPCPDGKCRRGLSCLRYYGIAGASGPQFTSCEIPCMRPDDCPNGQSCGVIADGPGQVCRPQRRH